MDHVSKVLKTIQIIKKIRFYKRFNIYVADKQNVMTK